MVIHHVVTKAEAMKVKLSLDMYMQIDLEHVVKDRCGKGTIAVASDRLVLRPSNGVVEASDYLSGEHDWVQVTEEEVTGPLRRCIYTPGGD
mmetsp:Transcript_181497/g.576179  ORF Transcript_181497/g.576179 Transcript_181497/m.576179 type:complete len:91 (+) Transcript_181497:156-428(+)